LLVTIYKQTHRRKYKMPFWTSPHETGMAEPKRKFRFMVIVNGIDGSNMMWYAKTATKPSFTIAAAEHKYLNHTFYYPGSVSWNEVTITLVDPVDDPGDMAATLSKIVEDSGYKIPTKAGTPADLTTLTKGNAVGALQTVTVRQLDHAGGPLESWTLNNAWISELTFGDLEYGSDDITELTMKLKYDWASLETTKAAADKSTKKVFDLI